MKKLLLTLIVVTLFGCGKKEDTPVATAPAPTVITYDQAIEAIMLAHPKSLQVCYDKNTDGFFLDYGPPYGDASEDRTSNSKGWLWIHTPTLYLMANGKYFMQDLTADKYVAVYPDTTGLPCRQH